MLNKNKSTIKSIIFSGLLAFGIMGVNDGFSSNYVNNLFDICEQYKGNTINQEQEQNVKDNIIGILNQQIGNQTFYDFFTSKICGNKSIPSKLGTKCSKTDVGNIVEKAFADGDFALWHCAGIPNIVFEKYNKYLMFAYSSKDNMLYVSMSSDFKLYNGHSILCYRYRITKQPNGEYKFEKIE